MYTFGVAFEYVECEASTQHSSENGEVGYMSQPVKGRTENIYRSYLNLRMT